MMPTRQDMQLARPLCRRQLPMRDGQRPEHLMRVTCWQPLEYWGWDNVWWCKNCQVGTDGYAVAAQARVLEGLAA